MELKEMEFEILGQCVEDYLGAWEIFWFLKSKTNAEGETLQQEGLSLLRKLLDDKLIRAFRQLREGKFEPVSDSVEVILTRIQRQKDLLTEDEFKFIVDRVMNRAAAAS